MTCIVPLEDEGRSEGRPSVVLWFGGYGLDYSEQLPMAVPCRFDMARASAEFGVEEIYAWRGVLESVGKIEILRMAHYHR